MILIFVAGNELYPDYIPTYINLQTPSPTPIPYTAPYNIVLDVDEPVSSYKSSNILTELTNRPPTNIQNTSAAESRKTSIRTSILPSKKKNALSSQEPPPLVTIRHPIQQKANKSRPALKKNYQSSNISPHTASTTFLQPSIAEIPRNVTQNRTIRQPTQQKENTLRPALPVLKRICIQKLPAVTCTQLSSPQYVQAPLTPMPPESFQPAEHHSSNISPHTASSTFVQSSVAEITPQSSVAEITPQNRAETHCKYLFDRIFFSNEINWQSIFMTN